VTNGVEHAEILMDRVMSDAYGQRFGERMRAEHAQAIITRGLREADLAVTEVRCDNPPWEMSRSIQQEDAFAVALHLREFPNRKCWEDGRRASVCDVRAGESCLYDLKRETTVLLDKPLSRGCVLSAACGAGRDR